MADRSGFEARYEKLRVLGEGAFGCAYLVQARGAENKGARYVAKEIRTAHLTAKQRQAAIGEAETLRKLQHPNVIGYETSFCEGTRMFIVMEYADGGDLAEKIKAKRESGEGAGSFFTEREVMFVFVQMCLALMHVHSRKILHRDLKPLNVFLTRHGNVKLGDFGVSTLLDSTTAGAQTMIGTPFYLSPEICNGEPYGVKSDVWSMGVVVYEVAALRVPFHAHALPAVALKICNADPDPLPDVYPRELHGLVFGLLDKEPKQRPKLRDLFALPYVKRWAQENLAHTQATGTGGCEEMARHRSSAGNRDRSEGSRERGAQVAAAPRQKGRSSNKENYSAEARRRHLEAEHQELMERQRRAMLADFLERKEAAEANKRRVESLMERERRSASGGGGCESPGPGGLAEGGGPCLGGAPRASSSSGRGEDNREEVRRRARQEQAERDAQRQRELVEAMRQNDLHRREADRQRIAREQAERREREAEHAAEADDDERFASEAGGAQVDSGEVPTLGATVLTAALSTARLPVDGAATRTRRDNEVAEAMATAATLTCEVHGGTAMVFDFSSDFKKSATKPRRPREFGRSASIPAPPTPPADEDSRIGDASGRQLGSRLRGTAVPDKVDTARPRACLEPLDAEVDAPRALCDSFPRSRGGSQRLSETEADQRRLNGSGRGRKSPSATDRGGGGTGGVMVFDFTDDKAKRRRPAQKTKGLEADDIPTAPAEQTRVLRSSETWSVLSAAAEEVVESSPLGHSASDGELSLTLKLTSPTRSKPPRPPRMPPSPAEGLSAAGPPARWLRSQAQTAAGDDGGDAPGSRSEVGAVGIAGRRPASPLSPSAGPPPRTPSPLGGGLDDSSPTMGSLSLSASPAPTPCGLGEVSQLQSALEGALAGGAARARTPVDERIAPASIPEEIASGSATLQSHGGAHPLVDTACSIRTDWDLSDSD